MNESDSNEETAGRPKSGGFDHVRLRTFDEIAPKTKDVKSARRSLMMRIGAYSVLAALAGLLIGALLDKQSDGPPPWMLVLPVVFGLVTLAVSYALMEGGGKVVAALHNPSPKSVPPAKQFSAAQALAARGHFDEAIEGYENAIAEDDSDPAPMFQVARILRDDLKRYEEAAVWFRRVQEHPNANSGAVYLAVRELTELYRKTLNQPQRALPLLARISETRPDSQEGRWAAHELAELRALVFPEESE